MGLCDRAIKPRRTAIASPTLGAKVSTGRQPPPPKSRSWPGYAQDEQAKSGSCGDL
ncbi:MAG: hypothetical protein ACFB12_12830 [Leptolyngbyaceae cyanobacterium]